MKREKKAAKSEKKAIVNCLSKQLRPNSSLNMFTQTLYEAIKHFQSHFPREVVYAEQRGPTTGSWNHFTEFKFCRL